MAEKKLGVTRGPWFWVTMLAVIALVIGIVVIFVLVQNDQLSRGWAYAVLPLGILLAATTRLLTLFKAVDEQKNPEISDNS